MIAFTAYCLSIFFIVLEVIVLLYMVRNILPFGPRIKLLIDILVIPVLEPVQKLVKHSIIKCFGVDISPYILLIILSYLESICEYLQR